MASDAQGGRAVKIAAGVVSVIGLGVFTYKQASPLLADVDPDHPGPLIAAGGVVFAMLGLAAWRWRAHHRDLSGRIRRRH